MSMIEITRDVKNHLLSRREITCRFKGLAGRLKKLEAVEMISRQFNLEGKVVVPILLKNETGMPVLSGTFYIYDDEKLARSHLKPAIFMRLEKSKGTTGTGEETQTKAEGVSQEAVKKSAEKVSKKEKKTEEKPKEESK